MNQFDQIPSLTSPVSVGMASGPKFVFHPRWVTYSTKDCCELGLWLKPTVWFVSADQPSRRTCWALLSKSWFVVGKILLLTLGRCLDLEGLNARPLTWHLLQPGKNKVIVDQGRRRSFKAQTKNWAQSIFRQTFSTFWAHFRKKAPSPLFSTWPKLASAMTPETCANLTRSSLYHRSLSL